MIITGTFSSYSALSNTVIAATAISVDKQVISTEISNITFTTPVIKRPSSGQVYPRVI